MDTRRNEGWLRCRHAVAQGGLFTALLIAVTSAAPGNAQIAVWPLTDGSHQMLNGFADGTPNNFYRFHEGIDILASGEGGELVRAIRGGKVLYRSPGFVGGMVTIEVTLPGGGKEYDAYLHVSNIAAPAEGMDIAANAPIGRISATFHEAGRRHLHLSIMNARPPRDDAPAENSFLNPYLRFKESADRDPLSNIPGLRDTNNDRQVLLVLPVGAANPLDRQPVKGDVNLIADLRDPQHDSLLRAVNPYRAGYYVLPLFKNRVAARGVKTADSPYVLAQFDDNWFAGTPRGKFALVYDETRPVDPNPVPNSVSLKNMIVTNTKGTDGRPANVENQYWRTKAKDDGAADDVAHANYFDKEQTDRNAMARFKDGEYEVHILLGDVINQNVDEMAGKLRLDNFEQKAGARLGGRPRSLGMIAPLYVESSAPWVPEFLPEPSSANPTVTFLLNERVGIFGDQYYPELDMPAFLCDHRPAWLEDDSLLGNCFLHTGVLSELDGSVPLTYVWTADRLGLFDVIIDYDRDGLFTWTLDGLGGFSVVAVPEPGVLAFFSAGLVSLVAFVRRHHRSGRK